MRAIHAFFLKQSKASTLIIVLFIVAALGYLDYIESIDVSISSFYLIPITIATWYIGKRTGYIIAFLSIATWLFSNWAGGWVYTQTITNYWNTANRLVIFILMIWLVDEFKRALNHERLLSHTDHLTGVPNSREFYFQANAELLRTSRFKLPITVAYFDVDSLKQVNDRFGHSAGDALLRTIAQSILSSIRQTDTVARLGGDEFAILLPNTDQNGARAIIGKVQARLAEQMLRTQPSATLSIGVVSFASAPASVDELLRKPDETMYLVKTTGKNSVLFIQA